MVSLNRDDPVRDGHLPGRLGAFNRCLPTDHWKMQLMCLAAV